jgi:hypothetical protein
MLSPRLVSNWDPPTSASPVTRITGICHPAWPSTVISHLEYHTVRFSTHLPVSSLASLGSIVHTVSWVFLLKTKSDHVSPHSKTFQLLPMKIMELMRPDVPLRKDRLPSCGLCDYSLQLLAPSRSKLQTASLFKVTSCPGKTVCDSWAKQECKLLGVWPGQWQTFPQNSPPGRPGHCEIFIIVQLRGCSSGVEHLTA